MYAGMNNPVNIQILPGQVTYFSFYGFAKYNFTMPPTPVSNGTADPCNPLTHRTSVLYSE